LRAPHFRRIPLFVAIALTAAGVAACSSSSSPTGSSTGSGPELTHVTVGALEIPDAVTLRIAQKDGFFKAQGLTVNIQTLEASEDTTPQLLSGTLDFTSENYVGMYAQEAAHPDLDLKVLADDGQGAPGVAELMVAPHSSITSVKQLVGKKIALPALGTGIGPLSLDVVLSEFHISTSSYTQVAVPFPDMPTALLRGEVDAAWVTEPFVTVLEKAGARPLEDVYTGELSGFPISCWATTGAFAKKYPKTVDAFQKAIEQAQQVASSDASLVRTLLPTYITGLSPAIANVMTLETFNTTPSLTRMERVANLMNEFKLLPSGFDASSMLYNP
jgi:NitT/TauT family transport system substrate-binding protein